MSERLGTKDLPKLCRDLWGARTKWDFIGLRLGIPNDEIKAINEDNGKVDAKFKEMLDYWLRNGDNRTWAAVCDALSDVTVGYRNIAERLREAYVLRKGQMLIEVEIRSQPDTECDMSSLPSQGSEHEAPITISPEASPQMRRGVVDSVVEVCQDRSSSPKGEDSACANTHIHTMGAKSATSTECVQSEFQSQKTSSTTPPDVPHVDKTPIKLPLVSGQQTHSRELCFREGYELRGYQKELAGPGLRGENYIIVAPTGSGKTVVAGYIIMTHLNKIASEGKKGKVAFVTPTRPLTEQQRDRLMEYIPGISVKRITGLSGTPMKPFIETDSIDVIVSTAGKLRQELQTKAVLITDFSLIIADECHHAGRPSNYRDIMEFYIREMKQSGDLPQIVGLTASPGAGRGKNPDVKLHLLSLCAVLDAKSGFIVVKENAAELQVHRNDPESFLEVSGERGDTEPFFQCVQRAMEKVEQLIGIVPLPSRISPEYISWIQNLKKEGGSNVEHEMERLSVLEQLKIYAKSMGTYREFRFEDAVHLLEESSHQSSAQQQIHDTMMSELHDLPTKPLNPLLTCMELIIQSQFEECPKSKGIIFVREVKHTKYIMNWIKNSSTLSKIIKVNSVAGYSHEESKKLETTAILQGFREDTYNVLASTSVLEEGLDVSKCNFVIRYQNVSNEIAQVQAKGRARAEGSKMYTVVADHSNWHDAYILQERKQRLVRSTLSTLMPETIKPHIIPWQKAFLEKRDGVAKQLEIQRSRWPDPENVDMCCKKCNVLACRGSELFIYTLTEDQLQHVIRDTTFAEKYDKRDHEKPVFTENFVKRYKIFCRSCGNQWGVIMEWKDTGSVYPALKCENFIFKCGNESQHFKKWKDICFKVRSIQDLEDYEEDVTLDETVV